MTVDIATTCTACGACITTCPERALLPAPRRPQVRDDRCTDCLACVEVCPADAIEHAQPTIGWGNAPLARALPPRMQGVWR